MCSFEVSAASISQKYETGLKPVDKLYAMAQGARCWVLFMSILIAAKMSSQTLGKVELSKI